MATDLNGNIFIYKEKPEKGKFVWTSDEDYYIRIDEREAVSVIAENPRDAAIRYGQRTGSCACCGRALSNKQSIDLGIGPICAEKWGFM